MDMARTLSLALPPINTHPEPKADINAVEDLRALNDSLMARNNQLAEEMSQLQGRHRQLVDELDAARSLVRLCFKCCLSKRCVIMFVAVGSNISYMKSTLRVSKGWQLPCSAIS